MAGGVDDPKLLKSWLGVSGDQPPSGVIQESPR